MKYFDPNSVSPQEARNLEVVAEGSYMINAKLQGLDRSLSGLVLYAPESRDELPELWEEIDFLHDRFEECNNKLKALREMYEERYGKYMRTTLRNRRRLEERLEAR